MYGVLVGVGVRAVVQGRPGARVAAVGLYLFALAAVTAGLAPKDLRGAPHTTTSDVHVYATVSGGAALLVAMAAIGRSEPGRRKIVTAAAAIVAVVATIVFRFTWGSPYYGAIERLVLVPGMAWLVLTAVWSWPKRERSADRSPPHAAACGGHRTRP
jgi:hypothetical protein